MKNFLCSLVVLIAAISSLSAETTGTPDNPPILTPPSTDNPLTPDNPPTTDPAPVASYPIGSFSKPVLAPEYATFLSDISGPQTESSVDAVQQKYLGTDSPVVCYGDIGDVQFAVSLEGEMQQQITTVPSYDAQYLFNLWRQNPTAIELASYLNDKYHLQWKTGFRSSWPTYSAEVGSINSAYPNSTTLLLADTIASNPQIGLVYTFLNDRETTLLTIQRSQFQSMDGWISTIKKQTDYYHRPSTITHDGVPMGN